jgi:hypothetical protein
MTNITRLALSHRKLVVLVWILLDTVHAAAPAGATVSVG